MSCICIGTGNKELRPFPPQIRASIQIESPEFRVEQKRSFSSYIIYKIHRITLKYNCPFLSLQHWTLQISWSKSKCLNSWLLSAFIHLMAMYWLWMLQTITRQVENQMYNQYHHLHRSMQLFRVKPIGPSHWSSSRKSQALSLF